MFEFSAAKREVLERLARQDWSPTDLATVLDKSPETVYNHLNDLWERGALSKQQVPGKTRPKTEYSIGDGFVQYVAALPGQFEERVFELDDRKGPVIRIWNVPQPEFHPYLEDVWWGLRLDDGIDLETDVTAMGVYGSVARGTAEEGSDVDLLVVAEDEGAESILTERLGSRIVETEAGRKLVAAQVYTEQDYRDSSVQGSDFLGSIQNELHAIYDPKRLFTNPEKTQSSEM